MLNKMVCGVVLGLMMAVPAGANEVSTANVELNMAGPKVLQTLPGIGSHRAMVIIAERTQAGPFRSWTDFVMRVPGVAEISAHKWSDAGMRVNGRPLPK